MGVEREVASSDTSSESEEKKDAAAGAPEKDAATSGSDSSDASSMEVSKVALPLKRAREETEKVEAAKKTKKEAEKKSPKVSKKKAEDNAAAAEKEKSEKVGASKRKAKKSQEDKEDDVKKLKNSEEEEEKKVKKPKKSQEGKEETEGKKAKKKLENEDKKAKKSQFQEENEDKTTKKSQEESDDKNANAKKSQEESNDKKAKKSAEDEENKEAGKEKSKPATKKNWGHKDETTLIQQLIEDLKSGADFRSKSKSDSYWTNLPQRLKGKLETDYSKDQVFEKYKRLKLKFEKNNKGDRTPGRKWTAAEENIHNLSKQLWAAAGDGAKEVSAAVIPKREAASAASDSSSLRSLREVIPGDERAKERLVSLLASSLVHGYQIGDAAETAAKTSGEMRQSVLQDCQAECSLTRQRLVQAAEFYAQELEIIRALAK